MVIITPISDKKKSTVPESDTVLFGGDYRCLFYTSDAADAL